MACVEAFSFSHLFVQLRQSQAETEHEVHVTRDVVTFPCCSDTWHLHGHDVGVSILNCDRQWCLQKHSKTINITQHVASTKAPEAGQSTLIMDSQGEEGWGYCTHAVLVVECVLVGVAFEELAHLSGPTQHRRVMQR